MRYDDPKEILVTETLTICDSKISRKLLSLGSVTKYEEIFKNFRKFSKRILQLKKLFQIVQTHKEALQHFEQIPIMGTER